VVDGAFAALRERGEEPPARVGLRELAREAASGGPAREAPPPAPEDPALLVYTSGTPGRSKGAVLTHGNLAATVDGLRNAWGWRASDRLLLTLPLFHVHGLVVGLLTALASGARVELRERFRADDVARELAAGAATLFFGVPTMYVRLVEAVGALPDRPAGGALASVRLFASGSAPLAPETFEAFRELTGHRILERYGMSETGMNLSNPLDGERRPGSVGVPLPGVEARIVGPGDRDVDEGDAGELLVRGPNVFRGYWRDPAKSAESFLPGDGGSRWFRTGDLARRDPASGYFTLLGRSRELILRGGYNVYPREIEEVLEAAPGVREAAVAGRPDPEWGQVPVAWVVADPGTDPDALLAHCRERLAGFKVPAQIRFLGKLPRNALGKVQKHRLENG
jgi:malonyl-CoA/methylmalonyl-CoA synthetase